MSSSERSSRSVSADWIRVSGELTGLSSAVGELTVAAWDRIRWLEIARGLVQLGLRSDGTAVAQEDRSALVEEIDAEIEELAGHVGELARMSGDRSN